MVASRIGLRCVSEEGEVAPELLGRLLVVAAPRKDVSRATAAAASRRSGLLTAGWMERAETTSPLGTATNDGSRTALLGRLERRGIVTGRAPRRRATAELQRTTFVEREARREFWGRHTDVCNILF